MDITFLGHSSFLIKGKTASVITDPFDKKIGFRFPKVGAEIVTISHDHFDHNRPEMSAGVRKIIEGPGEYEVSGISFVGIPSFHDDKKGELRGVNTIFVIEVDGMRVVHLGDLGHKLTEAKVEDIGKTDVLMIPVGGEWTIGPKEAIDVVQALEPKIIMPMHYKMKGLSDEMYKKLAPVEEFISGLEMKVEKTKKLKVTPANFVGEEQMIVVLEKK